MERNFNVRCHSSNDRSIIRNTLSVGIFFSSMETLAPYFRSLKTGNQFRDKTLDTTLASVSKLISIVATNPFYLLKTRAESGFLSKDHNMMSHIKEIYSANGIRGFYSGFFATFIRDVPYQAIQFLIYKILGETVNAFGSKGSQEGSCDLIDKMTN